MSVKWPKIKWKPKGRRRRVGTWSGESPVHVQVAKETGLDRKKCSVCGVISSYYNFHVHHINGDHEDNRPENLTVLCLDCHIAVHHDYSIASFVSETDGVYIEETNGVRLEDDIRETDLRGRIRVTITRAAFRCRHCNMIYYVDQMTPELREPKLEKCIQCEGYPSFKFIPELSKFKDSTNEEAAANE